MKDTKSKKKYLKMRINVSPHEILTMLPLLTPPTLNIFLPRKTLPLPHLAFFNFPPLLTLSLMGINLTVGLII